MSAAGGRKGKRKKRLAKFMLGRPDIAGHRM